jgi:hypothetical protein
MMMIMIDLLFVMPKDEKCETWKEDAGWGTMQYGTDIYVDLENERCLNSFTRSMT